MNESISRVVVLGAGTMGHGIAQVAAGAGFSVTLVDLTDERIQKGLARIRENLERGVKLHKVTPKARDETLARLQGCTAAETVLPTADLVVEAVPEKLELKRDVLATVGARARPNALVATNTSSLPLASLIDVLPCPARFIGLHFFNPPHLMRLVEIVVADSTAPETVETARQIVERLGKEGIVVHDSPGFATSRLGLVMGLEAMRMLEQGVASTADIDRAMELGYNHPMGPLKLTDLVGLDVRLEISETLARELDPARFSPPDILRTKVREGKLGRKTGEGFYRWTDDGPKPVD